jgi:drug/metabolite transporter (DMT)-like permease
MITAGLWAGERPRPGEWLGLLSAMGGLAYLVFPGIGAPDPIAGLLMTASGIAWGAYSLRGRASSLPVSATAGNFVRSLPLAILGILCSWETLHGSARGVALAVSSGALTSGLGYVLWFIALRGLTVTQAAIVQLAVPVIAAVGGIVVLAEEPTLRLAVASVPILGGVGGAILSRNRSGALDPCEGSPER